jgi:hypothetical protein
MTGAVFTVVVYPVEFPPVHVNVVEFVNTIFGDVANDTALEKPTAIPFTAFIVKTDFAVSTAVTVTVPVPLLVAVTLPR